LAVSRARLASYIGQERRIVIRCELPVDLRRRGLAADAEPRTPDAADLDKKFGPLAGPKEIKERERDDQGELRLNPVWYPLEEFHEGLLVEGRTWMYVIDERGGIFLGSDEKLGSVISDGQWKAQVAGMRAADPGLDAAKLRSALTGQGHPTVGTGFETGGATALARPARIAGGAALEPAGPAVGGQRQVRPVHEP
jgi:hypothetical protein